MFIRFTNFVIYCCEALAYSCLPLYNIPLWKYTSIYNPFSSMCIFGLIPRFFVVCLFCFLLFARCFVFNANMNISDIVLCVSCGTCFGISGCEHVFQNGCTNFHYHIWYTCSSALGFVRLNFWQCNGCKMVSYCSLNLYFSNCY